MMTDNADTRLTHFKRKRKTLRSAVSRFSNAINKLSPDAVSELEYNRIRLQEVLDRLIATDEEIQEFLPDDEYDEDVIKCEEYVDVGKRAILKASQAIQERTAGSIASLNTSIAGLNLDSNVTVTPSTTPVTHTVKLPVVKLDPFSGDVENWSRFWEQFQSSIDNNKSLAQIDKHVFLRGYLLGEPKNLVDGIPVTGDTYEDTKRILLSRYGNTDRIIQAHLDYLEAMKPISHASPEELNIIYIECNRRIQALRALGENVDEYGRMLAPKILRAFPEDIVHRWILHSRREKISESHITELMNFLNDEVESALTTHKIRDAMSTDLYACTAATLQINTKPKRKDSRSKRQPSEFCIFCETRGHWAQNCSKMPNVSDRVEKLKTSNRCFLCLNRGHSSRNCTKKGRVFCVKCKRPHHVSICNEEQPASVSVGQIDANIPNFTYLQTACIWIKGPTGLSKRTRCILDAGSQSSFINKRLVDQLKLNVVGSKDLTVTAFESSRRTSSARRLVEFTITGVWTKAKLNATAFESENTYSPHPTIPQDVQFLSRIGKLQLADPKDGDQDLPIELLIGGDQYWQIIRDEQPIRLSETVVLLSSHFGWILSGNTSTTSVNVSVNHICASEEPPLLDDDMRKFWDLETLGVKEQQKRTLSPKDATILQEFQESFRMENGRRVVCLPKKTDLLFSSNRKNAEKRFHSLTRSFHNNEEFREMYYREMAEYIKKEHVEMVTTKESTNEVFYLPHHAVKKGKDGSIKWRIVFDASSHERGQPSLNDFLQAGPNLLPEILSTLICFRTYQQAIVGDGTQAFLQLHLDERDRDLTRYFWFHVYMDEKGNCHTTDEIVIYRFTRLPFGLTCSPFLLSATLRELAAQFKDSYPTAAELLDRSIFMDDFVAGADDDNGAIALYYEITSLLRRIRMPMAKWVTSCEHLKDIWRAEGNLIKQTTRVLGVQWNTESDCLFLDARDITDNLAHEPATKRLLLKTTSKFYDPLGLLSPISVIGKILFQDTWCRGIEWDELLPHDIALKWNQWIRDLSDLSTIRVPRWIGLRHDVTKSFHVFCDASERAYGAALYVRSVYNGTISVHLICSKTRLSPVKKVTLPRLELLATLMGSRLLKYFCEATRNDITISTLWSDSMVVLGWLRSDANRWKTFVCNRVTEIQNILTPNQCRYCPSDENSADPLSRGLPVTTLRSSSLWWNGPSWLSSDPDSWPQTSVPCTTLPESRTIINQVLTVHAKEPYLDVTRYSSYWKAIRIMGWILRFLTNARATNRTIGELTANELQNARSRWIRLSQQESFASEYTSLKYGSTWPAESKITRFSPYLQDDIIRLGGRLQFADISEGLRHPILLDGQQHFVLLLIAHTHIRLHHLGVRIVLSELREEFWILRARQIVKKVLNKCLPCKMAKNAPYQQIEAPLPMDRVRPHRPFEVTGIDFAGPLYTSAGNTINKSYIVLFTCATTRAIHLELCCNMTLDNFLSALQRFVGRRGLPHTVYTDNARTFHASNKHLCDLWTSLTNNKTHNFFAQHNITWKFIAPRAAWWGGWWERMIGTVKRCLRKVLGKSKMSEDGLLTALIAVEAVINSRPLLQCEDDSEALTPAHFLIGKKLTTIPDGREPTQRASLTKEFRMQQRLVEGFWRRWEKEYLLTLRSFHEVRRQHSSIEPNIGDVALLQDDVRPRHMWRKVRIEKLLKGRDGKIRSLVLRTTDGKNITRPIQLVIPLEIAQGGEDVRDHHDT